MDSENQIITSKEIFYKKWGVNIPKAAVAATRLDMLDHVKGSTEINLEGEFIVINDNELLHNDINEEW